MAAKFGTSGLRGLVDELTDGTAAAHAGAFARLVLRGIASICVATQCRHASCRSVGARTSRLLAATCLYAPVALA